MEPGMALLAPKLAVMTVVLAVAGVWAVLRRLVRALDMGPAAWR